MQKKEEVIIKYKKGKLYISLFIVLFLLLAFIIRLTPLVQYYIVNLITEVMLNNIFNLGMLSTVLFALYVIEKKKFLVTLEELENTGGNQNG